MYIHKIQINLYFDYNTFFLILEAVEMQYFHPSCTEQYIVGHCKPCTENVEWNKTI